MKFLPTTFLKKVLTICLVVFSYQIHAQDDLEDLYIPATPSPKLAELSKYADFETIGQNGVVPIGIPLFSISAGQYKQPVSLSYHAGGIKVNQDATWVGLGWSLTMGGSITRSVRDVPDDVQETYPIKFEGPRKYTSTYVTEYGWLLDPGRIANFPDITNEGFETKSDKVFGVSDEIDAAIAFRTLRGDLNIYDQELKNYEKEIFDCEPDIFYLNIGQKVMKFIFDTEGNPKLLNSPEYFKIEPTLGGPQNITLESFVVTDTYGNKFYFGENNKIEKTTVHTEFYSTDSRNTLGKYSEDDLIQAPLDKTFTTGWFLTRVEVPSGEFISYEYYSPVNPLLLDIEVGQFRTKQLTENVPQISYNANRWNKTKSIEHSILTHYPERVVFPSGTVEIQLSPRSDRQGAYKLSSMVLKNNLNSLVNNIHFVYKETDGRMFLDWIMNNDKRTTFEYNDAVLPPKNSAQQDFWGYACAHSNDLIPQVYVYPNEPVNVPNYYRFHPLSAGTFALPEIILPGSDRRVDESSIRAGVLEIVHHPTGGTTTYSYEPNEYYDAPSGENITGGGLRIANIVKKENENDETPLLQREYHYNQENEESTGVLISDMAFASPTTFSFVNDVEIKYYFEGTPLLEGDIWDHFTLRASNNYFPLANLEGNQISYTKVEEIEVGNGKIVRHYHRPQNYVDHSTEVNTTPMIGFPAFHTWTIPVIELGAPVPGELYVDAYCQNLANLYWYVSVIGNSPGHYYSWGHVPDNSIFKTQSLFYKLEGIRDPKTGVIDYECKRDVLKSGYLYDPCLSCSKLYTFDFQDLYFGEAYDGIFWGNVKQNGKSIFPFVPLSDDGELQYEKLYKEEYFEEGQSTPHKVIDYEYELKNWDGAEKYVKAIKAQDLNVYSSLLKKEFVDAWDGTYEKDNFLSLVYNFYSMPKAWGQYNYLVNAYAFPKKTTVTTADKYLKSLKEETDFVYNHKFLLEEQSKVLSDETDAGISIQTTRYKYPHDFTSGSVYPAMTALNMYNYPVEEITLRNGEVVGGKLTEYNLSNGIYVPSAGFRVKTTDPIAEASFTWYDGLNAGTDMQKTIDYDFDSKGNLIHYQQDNNIDNAFLWGYNEEFPVAKLENAKYEETSSGSGVFDLVDAQGNRFTASQIDQLKNFTGTEDEYIAALENLRTTLSAATVTTFTYNPLVGMTSQTDVNGITSYYEYDTEGRLKLIKDQYGNIINHYEYQYRVQQ
jgi:hypothetical protein